MAKIIDLTKIPYNDKRREVIKPLSMYRVILDGKDYHGKELKEISFDAITVMTFSKLSSFGYPNACCFWFKSEDYHKIIINGGLLRYDFRVCARYALPEGRDGKYPFEFTHSPMQLSGCGKNGQRLRIVKLCRRGKKFYEYLSAYFDYCKRRIHLCGAFCDCINNYNDNKQHYKMYENIMTKALGNKR